MKMWVGVVKKVQKYALKLLKTNGVIIGENKCVCKNCWKQKLGRGCHILQKQQKTK